MWQSFANGRAIGRSCSEAGVILLDEEHREGARITLEYGSRTAPFAITCGIFGLMVHTRFFANEMDARRAYEEMKKPLDIIIQSVPFESDPDYDTKMKATTQAIGEFVELFP
jgi:hypothetical protein